MAIAYDATAKGTDGPVSSLTFAHTCTGTNLILFVGIDTNMGGPPATDTVTGVTYNSVAMTRIDNKLIGTTPTQNHMNYLYYLIAPATGAHDVVISCSASGNVRGASASYTGAQQSGVPDSHTTNLTDGATSLDTSSTTVADNCWVVSTTSNDQGSPTGGTNNTARSTLSPLGIGDTNGPVTPAGAISLTWNLSPSGKMAVCQASFAPVGITNLSVSVSDNINVSEAISSQLVNTASVVDNINVSESVTVLEKNLVASVVDNITIAESVTSQLVNNISVSDNVTVAETVTRQKVDLISVSDNVTVAETVTAKIPVLINVSDSITVSENITILEKNLVASVVDNITVAETITSQVIKNISVFDNVTVAESITVLQKNLVASVSDSITVAETITSREISNISVADSITVAENITIEQANLVLSVFDSIQISENETSEIISFVSVADNITVSESVLAAIPVTLSVFDSVIVNENIQNQVVSYISVVDNATVAENISSSPVYNLSVLDLINVSDLDYAWALDLDAMSWTVQTDLPTSWTKQTDVDTTWEASD